MIKVIYNGEHSVDCVQKPLRDGSHLITSISILYGRLCRRRRGSLIQYALVMVSNHYTIQEYSDLWLVHPHPSEGLRCKDRPVLFPHFIRLISSSYFSSLNSIQRSLATGHVVTSSVDYHGGKSLQVIQTDFLYHSLYIASNFRILVDSRFQSLRINVLDDGLA